MFWKTLFLCRGMVEAPYSRCCQWFNTEEWQLSGFVQRDIVMLLQFLYKVKRRLLYLENLYKSIAEFLSILKPSLSVLKPFPLIIYSKSCVNTGLNPVLQIKAETLKILWLLQTNSLVLHLTKRWIRTKSGVLLLPPTWKIVSFICINYWLVLSVSSALSDVLNEMHCFL